MTVTPRGHSAACVALLNTRTMNAIRTKMAYALNMHANKNVDRLEYKRLMPHAMAAATGVSTSRAMA
jgi:hypothetical protein